MSKKINTVFIGAAAAILMAIGVFSIIFGLLCAIWIPKNGEIISHKVVGGCETCSKLATEFEFRSKDDYSGKFKEKVRSPAENNITVQDLYDLHPIGSSVNIYANPLFTNKSTQGGKYPALWLFVTLFCIGYGVCQILQVISILYKPKDIQPVEMSP